MILDIESTSLSPDKGFPVQIAMKDNGKVYHCYIDISNVINDFEWSDISASVHGLSKDFLNKYGIDPSRVCHILNDKLSNCDNIYSDSSLDDKWLNNLFSACNIEKRFSIQFKELYYEDNNSLLENHLAHHDVIKLNKK